MTRRTVKRLGEVRSDWRVRNRRGIEHRDGVRPECLHRHFSRHPHRRRGDIVDLHRTHWTEWEAGTMGRRGVSRSPPFDTQCFSAGQGSKAESPFVQNRWYCVCIPRLDGVR